MSIVSIPAPVGGWNSRDPLSAMPPTDAVVMQNFIPRAGYVEMRTGFAEHSAQTSVQTLAVWGGATGQKMIGARSNGLYDFTVPGAGTLLKGGFGINYWQHININGKLILANGFDVPQVYNGTTMIDLVVSVSTIAPATILGCYSYKGRAWYWQNNSQSVWYCDAGSYQGTLTELPLGAQLTKGGKLVLMGSLTLDGGDGADDLAVFCFSTGETLVYQGDDPASAASWQLVGRFEIGAPLGVRSFARMGGASIVLTRRGLVDVSRALSNASYSQEAATANSSAEISSKIERTWQRLTALWGVSDTEWFAIDYPSDGLFCVRLPAGSDLGLRYAGDGMAVLNTKTGAWCLVTVSNATPFYCACIFNGQMYVGQSANLLRWTVGYERIFVDTITSGGADIKPSAVCIQAPVRPTNGRKTLVGGLATVTNYNYPQYIFTTIYADFNLPTFAAGLPTLTVDPAAPDASSYYETPPMYVTWQNASGFGETFMLNLSINQGRQRFIWYETRFQLKLAGGK